MSRAAALLAGVLTLHAAYAWAAPGPSAKPHVVALASPRFDGRLTGSPGERLSGDYIIAELRRIGAKPLPGRTDYRLPFDFTAGSRDGGSTVTMATEGSARPPQVFSGRRAVEALSFSEDAEVSGPVVFAGYGLVVPPGQDVQYDSYATLDVTNKIVLVLRYFPEDADAKTKGLLARYSDLRYKALAARQRGAKGLLVVTGPRSPNAGQTIPMRFDTALAGSGIAATSVSAEVGAAILTASGRTLADEQRRLDPGTGDARGFAVPGASITIRTRVVREKQTAANIAAYLPATAAAAPVVKPWIALGAHYDHLGHGDHGNSLAGKGEAGQVHAGADDNASGSAAVLAAGASLANAPRQRHVLLAFWSGEELGLIGSNAFVTTPAVRLGDISAYLNFDMVGRMQDNRLTIQATGTSPSWPGIIERANIAAGFDVRIQTDPYQPTDVSNFNQAGLPCLNFFTGTHVDYHRPSDTADKINYEDLDRVVELAVTIAGQLDALSTPLAFAKVEPQTQGTGRAGARVFTGTIPDYSTEAKGLLLGGVVGGGPADVAGLQKGDVMTAIAGQAIANIYDYTYALEILKIGEPVEVVFVRNGQQKKTTLTPAARR